MKTTVSLCFKTCLVEKAFCVLLIFLCSLQSGNSVTRFFEGGDWHEPLNWLNEIMPSADEDVIMQGSGTIKQSITCNNIAVGDSITLTISSGTVTARQITVFSDGTLVNNGTLDLIIDFGYLSVMGEVTNSGQITVVTGVAVAGSIANNGTITGSTTSVMSVGNGGVFNNSGTIDGTGVNFQINNGTFNNGGIINIDLSTPSDFILTSTGLFSNTGSIITNARIQLKDDAVFENRNIMNIINSKTNHASLWIEDNAIFRNFVNLQLDQQTSLEVGIIVRNAAIFENFGTCVLKNAPLSILTTNPAGGFENHANADIHISNTDVEGLRINSVHPQAFLNHGIISMCQTNQVSGTCPLWLISNSTLINLPNSTLFTGVDIFNGNCSSATINNISNQGDIIASCGPGIPPICPLDFTGPNSISGVYNSAIVLETDGPITATNALILQGPTTFDSGISVTLDLDFEVAANTVFEAFIDGCGGL